MKKIIFVAIIALFFFGLSVVNYSCKEKTTEDDTVKTVLNEQSTLDAVYLTDAYSYVISDVLVSADANDGEKALLTTCASVTLVPTIGYPKTLTIDYGTNGCVINGITIKGLVTAQISNRIRQQGTTVSVTFSNFSIDTLAISGSFSLTIEEVDLQNSKINFDVAMNNCTINIPSGDFSFNGSLDVDWDLKTLTDYTDDEFEFETGTFTGTNLNDKTYEATILEPLYYDVSCGNMVQGKLEIKNSDLTYPATINFGSGECDNVATISTTIELVIGNQTIYQDFTYEITLP